MHIRDKYIDRQNFKESEKIDNQEQFNRAKEFFSQFPEIDLQAEKVRCPKCNLLHKVYCLKCGELLVNKDLIPKVELPVNLFILHHNKEKHQKSSAIPAKFLSDQVEVKDYPGEFEFDEHTYILYPHQNAKYIKELSQEEIQSIKKFVAIDCTWHQTGAILETISKKYPNQKFLKLEDYQTYFWRYQHHSLKCLATIEAIYYCYQEYSKAMNIDKNYDNLLFFYKYTFQQMTESIKKEIGNPNVYEKIEQKKQRILQAKQDAKKEKQFKKLM
ncbi:unnamed protein product [Paramecium octaurelia]|uniref:tRNA-uridine aminocarboxypropyltransferase 1 n=1 Tax=Paramecium octaurelia TaxID=43137 RepID=A0A8S1U2S4_PAROT|nr:unnamed protein product [Paramecium octaurelia]